jgi:hypothetical protein
MSAESPFNPRLVFGLIAAGTIGFAALVLLLAFGGNFGDSGSRAGRAHALSVSAVGYKGLVDLVGAFHETYTIQGPEDFGVEDLVVVALEPGSRPADLKRLLDQRHGKATMIILPKWETVALSGRSRWVRALSPTAAIGLERIQDQDVRLRIASRPDPRRRALGRDFLDGLTMPVPAEPQVIEGAGLTPLVSLPDGGALVARMGNQPHYLVADPDLLNNHGLRNPEAAEAALALIDGLNATDAQSVAFDLTVNGLGASRSARPSLLRTAFEPPFVVMTLALVAAALLAGLHGAVRFGQAKREERAIALGKSALVENSAGLIRLARREARLGAAYADLVRHEAARTASAPAWLTGAALDAYLDRLSRSDRPNFSALAARLGSARDRHELVAAARALFSWKKDIIR